MKKPPPPAWIPDWRDPSQYPDIKNTTRRNWAWQFLRRNPEYQQAYSQLLQHPHAKFRAWTESGCIELKHLSVVDPEEDYTDFEGKFHFARIKYGTGFSLYDPSYGCYELRCLSVPGGFGVIKDVPKLTESLVQHTTTQIPVLIDLTIPIEPQLNTIKAALKPFGRRVFGKLRRSTHQVANFQTYLRILDAKACKAKNSEIGKILFPYMTNEYPDFMSVNQVKAAAKAAQRYMSNDYKIVLFNAPPEARWEPPTE